MSTGLCLVEIACLRTSMATIEAAWKAARARDAPNVAASGLASAGLVLVALSAVLAPELWLATYDWTAAHAFVGTR